MYIVSCNQFHILVVPKLVGGKVGRIILSPCQNLTFLWNLYKLRVPYQIY